MTYESDNETRTDSILEYVRHNFPDSLLANGYDTAIIGVAGGFDSGRVAYSVSRMIEIAANDLSVDYDEALEWLEYNTFGAYIGSNTPIYIDRMEKKND